MRWGLVALIVHVVVLALVPSGAARRGETHEPIAIEFVESLALERAVGSKDTGGGDDPGGDPVPSGVNDDGLSIGRDDARSSARPGAAREATIALTEALAGALRTLGTEGTRDDVDLDVATATASRLALSSSTIEALGHAPARGCPPGEACGAFGARGEGLIDRGSTRALASTSGAPIVMSDPCHGLHVCPRRRLRAPYFVETTITGGLAYAPVAAVRMPIHRAARRCLTAQGEPGAYPFGLGVAPDGRVLALMKLDASREGEPRLECLARALSTSTFPIADGGSRIRVVITMGR
ncbi:hypothetical protein [Sandaracinus amylolyticus]|uniref:hypothetical protein n=1 Tax=Sandaracinus amylolyticus TaxID=927083 RepID=UPI001F41415D|nr:hypothetical protein [Sandaracinus amylolyticus]UJR81911.1 Hypothetical protein I5071_39760 [Sandaracinus amylolyticus]